MFKVVVLFFSLFSSVTFASTSNGDELFSLLTSDMTYQADFHQQTVAENNVVSQKNNGKVYIHYPGRFRWESKQPTDQVLIVNGNQVWIYDKDLAQVTEQKLESHANSIAVLLTGSKKDINKNFTIKKIKTIAKNMGFLLTPKTKSNYAQMTEARFYFSDKKLTSIQVKNSLGDTTKYYFSDIQLNKKLKPSLFNFKVPAGVDVLKQ